MRGCLVFVGACGNICVPHTFHTHRVYIKIRPPTDPLHQKKHDNTTASSTPRRTGSGPCSTRSRGCSARSTSSLPPSPPPSPPLPAARRAWRSVSRPFCFVVCLWLSYVVDIYHVRLIPSSIHIRVTNKAEGRVGVGVSGRRRQRGGAGGREGEQRGGGPTWGGGVHVIPFNLGGERWRGDSFGKVWTGGLYVGGRGWLPISIEGRDGRGGWDGMCGVWLCACASGEVEAAASDRSEK